LCNHYYLGTSSDFDYSSILLIRLQRVAYLGLILTPLLLGLSFEKFGITFQFLLLIPLAVVSGPLFLIDATTLKLPNSITYPVAAILMIMRFTYSIYTQKINDLTEPIFKAFLFAALFLCLYLITRGGVGAGDVKLAFIIGLSIKELDVSILLALVLISFILSAAYSLALLIRGGADLKSKIPFGPFLLLGAWASTLFLVP